MPLKLRTGLGRTIGDVLRYLSPSRRHTALVNIRAAFPNTSAHWQYTTMCASFQNLGITIVELLTFPHIAPREAREMLDLRGVEGVETAMQESSGVLLLSGHFGNWELLGFALPLYIDIATTLIVAPQVSKIAETYLSWYRQRTGNRTVPVNHAARSIVHSIQTGEAIAMLADLAAPPPDHNVFVDFFGRAASTYDAPARIALRFNVALFVAFAERLENGCYRATITRIPHEDLTYNSEGITELTKRHVAALEAEITKRPDLWTWQHNRWAYQPPIR